MRTTVNLDDDVLRAARSLAHARSISLGAALSELVRTALTTTRAAKTRNGFPVFQVPQDAPPITLEDVKRWEDDA